MSNFFNDNYAVIKPEFPVTNSIVPDWNILQAQIVMNNVAAQQNYWNMLAVFQQYASMYYPNLNFFVEFRGTI